jgi:hypothetical protein
VPGCEPGFGKLAITVANPAVQLWQDLSSPVCENSVVVRLGSPRTKHRAETSGIYRFALSCRRGPKEVLTHVCRSGWRSLLPLSSLLLPFGSSEKFFAFQKRVGSSESITTARAHG